LNSVVGWAAMADPQPIHFPLPALPIEHSAKVIQRLRTILQWLASIVAIFRDTGAGFGKRQGLATTRPHGRFPGLKPVFPTPRRETSNAVARTDRMTDCDEKMVIPDRKHRPWKRSFVLSRRKFS